MRTAMMIPTTTTTHPQQQQQKPKTKQNKIKQKQNKQTKTTHFWPIINARSEYIPNLETHCHNSGTKIR